ncbi:MAG TPA: circularly permuted type 2 ATP-grasp protein [Candidatus Dormibacteraeota bacterium]|nr:circularly permuted type 2 ATP-grasp protein [Candidatus Dormibacteraeota bacterium]
MSPAARPADVYHALLEDAALAEASAEALRRGQERRRLTFGERPLSISLRPNLLDRARYDESVSAARALYGALGALQRALLADGELRAELDLEPEEERLALADPGCRSSSPSARLDSFFGERVRYVEYNAESPAGMAYEDNMADVFAELPVMREFSRRFAVRTLPVRERQLASMLRAFAEWDRGRGERPAMAIVDWTGLPTATEFELFQAFFEAAGVPTVICDPRELELRGGRLVAGDRAVNLVYRRVLTSELLARRDEVRALLDAYMAGAACVVNTFRAKLLHKKMSLALLSDERYAGLYTPEQRSAIARHVPWTRKVTPDLVDRCAERRTELVLKPNDEYGGKGVVLGWTVEQHEWEQALEVAATQSYVVQEAVEVPREPFPVALDDVHMLDLAVDLDPYLFDGEPGGCLTRLSSSALLNVTAGAGSMVPTYVVEGER